MTDPRLDDAVNAFRSAAEDGLGEDRETRHRVLDSLDRRAQRHRTLVAFGLVFGLGFVGTSAWAWKSGWIPSMLRVIRGDAPEVVAAPEPVASAKKPRRSAPVAAPAPEPEPAPAPVPAPTPVPAPAPVRRVPVPAPVAVPEPAPAPAPVPEPVTTVVPPAPPPPDPELLLYRRAHNAHFRDNDAARALTAWDAYLASYPDGKLALEARWNRAITLVRLGRNDEARAALEPFANGTKQGYRQIEALHLLRTLPR
jgi:TolA-binding protein